MIPDDWGTGWTNPAVEAELLRPRGRGRPAGAARMHWAAAIRLQAGQPGSATRQRDINREVLEARRVEVVAQRRGALHLHRADRRDEARQARRALVAVMAAMRPALSAQSLAMWIKRSCTGTIGSAVTVRTLRDDISAIRKAGNTTHAPNSARQ